MPTALFQPLRFLIVDDEPLAREVLELFISQLPAAQCVASCSNASEALAVLQKEQVDVTLVDIEMPQLKGTELASLLKGKVKVIFTTAYPQYALEAFDLQVVDYLMKPIPFKRFAEAIEKVKSQQENLPSIALQNKTVQKQQTILLRCSGKNVPVNSNEIAYLEGDRDYVHLYSLNWEKLTCRDTLQHLGEALPSKNFLRIHRSFIIQMKYVQAFTRDEIEVIGISLPVGRSYKSEVEERLLAFFKS